MTTGKRMSEADTTKGTPLAALEVTYSCGHKRQSFGTLFQMTYPSEPVYMACSPECDDRWRAKR